MSTPHAKTSRFGETAASQAPRNSYETEREEKNSTARRTQEVTEKKEPLSKAAQRADTTLVQALSKKHAI